MPTHAGSMNDHPPPPPPPRSPRNLSIYPERTRQ